MPKAIHTRSLRVVRIQGGAAAGLHVLPTKGEEFVITMSGEGLAKLGDAIKAFLEKHPEMKSQKIPTRH